MPGGQSSSRLRPEGSPSLPFPSPPSSLSLLLLFLADKSTGSCWILLDLTLLIDSRFTRLETGVDDVEDVVDKGGDMGVDVRGPAPGALECPGGKGRGTGIEAAAAAAAKAATKELWKNGVENKALADLTAVGAWQPPKVGLRMLSIEKVKGFESMGRLAGKKGWNKDVGVGRIGKRGGELTVEESSSSSISSLMRDAVVSSGSTELSSVFMMIMTG